MADTMDLPTALIFIVLAALTAYFYGKGKRQIIRISGEDYQIPALNQIIVNAKYVVKAASIQDVYEVLKGELNQGMAQVFWKGVRQRNALTFDRVLPESLLDSLREKVDLKKLDGFQKRTLVMSRTRSGLPMQLRMVGSETESGEIEFEATVLPVMYFKIAQTSQKEFTKHEIEEAQHECMSFASQLRGIIGGREVEPPRVMSPVSQTDVRRRLVSFNMTSQAELLASAETKIQKGEAPDGVKNCRSALEQTVEKLITRINLEPTDSFRHNLDRLVKNRYLDPLIADSIQEIHYRLLSEDVHDKYSPKPKEARFILDMTETTIGFLLGRIL